MSQSHILGNHTYTTSISSLPQFLLLSCNFFMPCLFLTLTSTGQSEICDQWQQSLRTLHLPHFLCQTTPSFHLLEDIPLMPYARKRILTSPPLTKSRTKYNLSVVWKEQCNPTRKGCVTFFNSTLRSAMMCFCCYISIKK